MKNLQNSWIVFSDSKSLKNRFLKKNFRHMYILTHDDFNWYMIDPDWRFLNVKILPFRANFNLPNRFLDEGRVVHIKHLPCTDKHLLNPLRLFTCVEIVKYALGLSMFTFTPFGLYKKLKRLNIRKHKTIFYVNELGGN